MARPEPQNYRTAAEYRWARRQWRRGHGGALWSTLAIAVFFGLATRSVALLLGLIVFAIGAHLVARSRP